MFGKKQLAVLFIVASICFSSISAFGVQVEVVKKRDKEPIQRLFPDIAGAAFLHGPKEEKPNHRTETPKIVPKEVPPSLPEKKSPFKGLFEKPEKTSTETSPGGDKSLNYLSPAGHKGDPGFQFSTLDSNGFVQEGCRGALIYASDGKCIGATAAHCFDGKNGTRSIGMRDFGRVIAQVSISPGYKQGASGNDVAAFTFACPQVPKNVEVLSLARNDSLRDGKEIAYGSFKGMEDGVHKGIIHRGSTSNSYGTYVEGKLVNVKTGHSMEFVRRPLEYSTESGDSGSPMYLKSENEKTVLYGVLSGASMDMEVQSLGLQQAIYSTNHSLDFLRDLIAQN